MAGKLERADSAVRDGASDDAENLLLGLLEELDSSALGVRARVGFRLGRLLCSQGRTDDAAGWLEQSMHDAQQAGDLESEAYALNGLAAIAQRRGDLDRADELWQKTCALAAQRDCHRLIAMASQNRAVVFNIRGDFGAAMAQYRESLRSFERAQDNQGIAWVANNLGMLLADLRRFAEALEMFRIAARSANTAEDLGLEGLAEGNRAATLLEMGQSQAAYAPATKALAIAHRRGDILREAEARRSLGIFHLLASDLEGAHIELSIAYDLAKAASDKLLCAELLAELGELSCANNDLKQAGVHWAAAERSFREIGALLDAEDVAERRRQRMCPA